MDTLHANMDTVLSNDLLQALSKRVGSYDRENRFFKEDFEDLRKAGYLTMSVPREFGGPGLSLADVCRRQRRLDNETQVDEFRLLLEAPGRRLIVGRSRLHAHEVVIAEQGDGALQVDTWIADVGAECEQRLSHRAGG